MATSHLWFTKLFFQHITFSLLCYCCCLGLFRNSPVERCDDNECTVDDLIERQVRKAIYSRFGDGDSDGMYYQVFVHSLRIFIICMI